MPKERSVNPATAHLKSEKSRAIKKNKAAQTSLRNEKLARRNPQRLQRQIDDLKAAEASGVPLRPKDKQDLERLEKEVQAVRRAREALGDKAPQLRDRLRSDGDGETMGGGRSGFAGRGRRGEGHGGGVLGKRRRGAGEPDGSSDTDPEARGIPMPKDVENMPPPPPPPRRQQRRPARPPYGQGGDGEDAKPDTRLPPKPPVAAQTVYSSAPQIRDLRREAARFVPAAVRQKIRAVKGEGGRLLEPEEADRLEKEGYRDAQRAAEEAEKEAEFGMMAVEGMEEEERRFERELRRVEVEEVEDEGT